MNYNSKANLGLYRQRIADYRGWMNQILLYLYPYTSGFIWMYLGFQGWRVQCLDFRNLILSRNKFSDHSGMSLCEIVSMNFQTIVGCRCARLSL
jgi:hypothetical protein